MASKFKLLCRLCINAAQKRSLASDKPWPPPKLKAKYELFQRDDGVPVHLKSGYSDKMLYQFTFALSVLGSIWGYMTMISMAFPKKGK